MSRHSRIDAGHLSRARGQAFEEQLDMLHGYYDAHELAFLRHNGTQAVKRGGNWVPKKSLPDYEGCLSLVDGRHVAFDAKYRTATSPSYHHPTDGLHQTDYLWRVSQRGGIAFLLVVLDFSTPEKDDVRGWILWPQHYWQEHYGKGWSIPLVSPHSVLPEFGLPVPAWDRVCPGYIPDWLQLIHQIEGVQCQTC